MGLEYESVDLGWLPGFLKRGNVWWQTMAEGGTICEAQFEQFCVVYA